MRYTKPCMRVLQSLNACQPLFSTCHEFSDHNNDNRKINLRMRFAFVLCIHDSIIIHCMLIERYTYLTCNFSCRSFMQISIPI